MIDRELQGREPSARGLGAMRRMGKGRRVKKRLTGLWLTALCCALMAFMARTPVASAADGLTVTPTLCTFRISDESFDRDLETTTAALPAPGSDLYYSFCFGLRNDGAAACRVRSSYVQINGGEHLGWSEFSLEPGHSTLLHVYSQNMQKLSAGIYRVDLYLNDSLACTQYFTLTRDWAGTVSLPDASQISACRPSDRAPYIVFTPDYAGIDGFTAYSVDFVAGNLPKGTYLSTCNWWLDDAWLRKQYASVDMQGVSGYCGFQVLADGTHVAIMSLWDIYCKDRSGNQTTLRAKRTYPKESHTGDTFGGEGNGVHCLTPYNWLEGHPYRMLLQQERAESGNVQLTMWVCDLESMAWTRLISYDTGIPDTYIRSAVCFLEDFVAQDGALRSMELANLRVLNRKDGQWKPVVKGSFAQNYDYPGSYAFGADKGEFWCVTTAIQGLWGNPRNNQRCQTDAYDPSDPF